MEYPVNPSYQLCYHNLLTSPLTKLVNLIFWSEFPSNLATFLCSSGSNSSSIVLRRTTSNTIRVLGYELGTQWTPHHKVIDYVQHLAEHSEIVGAFDYGTTYEGRELVYIVISSEQESAEYGGN